MDRQALITALNTLPPARFVEEYLFDSIPNLFDGDRSSYIAWKRLLGNEIDVDPACLTIVGSAAVGCSMNPRKNLAAFGAQSDVDVAVVSNYYFTVGWRYLRMNGSRRSQIDARTLNAWDEHVQRYVYWGTIATDRLLGVLPFGADWLRAAGKLSSIEPTAGRDVNLRIYADYEALRSYQIQSVRALRDRAYA